MALASIVALVLGLASRVLHNDPVIVLDDDGIWDSRWGLDQATPWCDIRSARECGVHEICLHIDVPLADKPANSGSLVRTAESLFRLETNAWGLRISRRRLLSLIREHLDEARL